MPAEEDSARYVQAAHAMQTGVAFKMQYDPAETTPKHLRVGVNSAHVSIAALTQLLIDKGVFTMDEYAAANAKAMEDEVEKYRAWLSKRTGASIELG